MDEKKKFVSHLRSFVFGVEDSLVSTVGLLSGIAASGMSGREILLTGSVLVLVEAFSMAAGSFLSEYSAEEYLAKEKVMVGRPLLDGTIMFFSYFLSGFIPLFPYLLFLPDEALPLSIGFSLLALAGLGYIGSRITGASLLKGAIRMVVVGGIAIGAGILVGAFFS